MALFSVENWLKTPTDRDVISRWTREAAYKDLPLADRYRLTLLPTVGDTWEFLALGDSGDADAVGPNDSPQDAVGQELAHDAAAPVGAGQGAFVLHTGDVVYMTGERRLYERNFRRPYAPFLAPESTVDNMVFRLPFLPVPGNHDYYDLGGWAKWLAKVPVLGTGLRALSHQLFAFGIPEDGSDMGRAYMEAFVEQGSERTPYAPSVHTRLPNRYYQFTIGGVDFFALDSNTLDAPHPSADLGALHRAAQDHLQTLEAKAKELNAALRAEQRTREEQRREARAAIAGDPSRLEGLRRAAWDLNDRLTLLLSDLVNQEADAAAHRREAARTVEMAARHWNEGTEDLTKAEDPADSLRALDQLDESGDEICRALLELEEYLGNLPAGSGAHARLTTESDAVDRGQAEYAAQAAPWSSDSDARLHALSEEALDVQRELALEQRRERYRPADHDAAQFAWLDAALTEAQRARPENWRIVFLHHPIYTTIGNHIERADVQGLRENLLPLLQPEGRVHLLLAGHSHAFEWLRSRDLPHTGIFVSGGGGQITLRRSFFLSRRFRRNVERYESLRLAGLEECASGGAGPSAPDDGADGPLFHYLRFVVRPDVIEVHPIGVRSLEGVTGPFRREEPMPVFHTPDLPATPRRPSLILRRLSHVEVRRSQPPQAIWR